MHYSIKKLFVIIIIWMNMQSNAAALKPTQEESKIAFEHTVTQSDIDYGWTPEGKLLVAVFDKNIAGVRRALRLGAHPDARIPNTYHTALIIAAENGSESIAALLIERKANVNASNIAGTTPLMASGKSNNSHLTQLLIEKGADIHARNNGKEGYNALMYAILSKNIASATTLIDCKSDVNAKVKTGETTIMVACSLDLSEVIQKLLDHKADPFIKSGSCDSLDCAKDYKSEKSIAVLREYIDQHVIHSAALAKLTEDEARLLDKEVTLEQQAKLAKKTGGVPWVKLPTIFGIRSIVADYLIVKQPAKIIKKKPTKKA